MQVSTDALRVLVTPLRRDELAGLAEVWAARLQAVQAELAETRLASRQATEDAARRRLIDEVLALEARRNAIADRLEVVLGEISRKGGDTAELRDYLVAIRGVDLDVSDFQAAVARVRTWLLSRDGGVAIGLNLLKFGLALVLALLLSWVLGGLTHRAVGRMRRTSQLLREFLAGLVRKAVMVVGVVIGLSFLGVNIGPLVAAIGAAGLVVGLALQGTLSNFASGILILLYRPYDVGHVINGGGVTGTVEAMTLVSTTIISFDNQRIVVPNNSIWGGTITNITGNRTRRVDLKFGISYSDDVDKAAAVLNDIVSSHPLVLKDPAPVVRLHELGESSVNFVVRPWAATSDYWQVYWDVTRAVKQRFDAQEISIPFPQRDVHLHQAEAA